MNLWFLLSIITFIIAAVLGFLVKGIDATDLLAVVSVGLLFFALGHVNQRTV